MKKFDVHIPPFIALALVALGGVKYPYIITVLLFAMGTFMIFYKFKKEKLFLFLFVSVMGPIAEIVAISYGQWNYTFYNLYNIPTWLIPLWGCAALYIVGIWKLFSNKKTA